MVGDGLNDKTHLGPVINKDQYERIIDFVADAKEQGAKIVTGTIIRIIERLQTGSPCAPYLGGTEKKGKDSGFFIEPTVIADVNLSMRVAKEEIFGPVAAIIK